MTLTPRARDIAANRMLNKVDHFRGFPFGYPFGRSATLRRSLSLIAKSLPNLVAGSLPDLISCWTRRIDTPSRVATSSVVSIVCNPQAARSKRDLVEIVRVWNPATQVGKATHRLLKVFNRFMLLGVIRWHTFGLSLKNERTVFFAPCAANASVGPSSLQYISEGLYDYGLDFFTLGHCRIPHLCFRSIFKVYGITNSMSIGKIKSQHNKRITNRAIDIAVCGIALVALCAAWYVAIVAGVR